VASRIGKTLFMWGVTLALETSNDNLKGWADARRSGRLRILVSLGSA
jgi:hypothetical protein